MTTTLICVLGKVPGPVTTTIHALKGKGLRPDCVYVLQTDEQGVKIAAAVVEAYLKREQIEYRPIFVAIENITRDEEADIFRRELDKTFKSIPKTQDDCLIVSMTGGRKTMSSFMALTAQFYPVDHLFDIWVASHLEQDTLDPRTAKKYCEELEANRSVDKLEPDVKDYNLIEFPLMPLVKYEITISELDTLSLFDEITTTIKLPEDRLNLVLRGMSGRVDLNQARDLIDLETALRETPRPDHGEKIRGFLSGRMGKPYERQHWPPELSQDTPISAHDFEDRVLLPIQNQLDVLGFPVDLVGVWNEKQAEIRHTYHDNGRAAQYLVTLLRLALRVGYRLTQPTMETLQQIGPVFVSYAHDDLAAVDRIVRDLRSVGIDILWDRDIRGGQEWFDMILLMMGKCNRCIFFVTKTSLEKHRGYIRQEISHYRQPGRQLIPVLLDGQQPDKDDLYLEKPQWIRFQHRRYDEFFDDLLSALVVDIS
ncbi:MAG: hypothetical protein DPW16_22210 [Chloroflexi bacterium]|nr:hypothetical protein [Chloroflexota bacterium]